MLAAACVGNDVGCIEDWEGVLLGDCTRAVVGVEDADSEDALAEPRNYLGWFSRWIGREKC